MPEEIIRADSSTSPLPIKAVFAELHSKDLRIGRSTITLDISCSENEMIANPIRLIVKTPEEEIYNLMSNLCHLYSKKYEGENMRRAVIILSNHDFAKIKKADNTEITFTDGSKQSTFQIKL